jgi:hypothetical protein
MQQVLYLEALQPIRCRLTCAGLCLPHYANASNSLLSEADPEALALCLIGRIVTASQRRCTLDIIERSIGNVDCWHCYLHRHLPLSTG